MSRVAFALLLLSGCTSYVNERPKWPAGLSVVTVMVSEALPRHQIELVHEVVGELNRISGARRLLCYEVSRENVNVNGLPRFGVIGVSDGHPQDPRAIGETTIYRTKASDLLLHSADVRLTPRCGDRCVVHELLHAMGLGHEASGLMELHASGGEVPTLGVWSAVN